VIKNMNEIKFNYIITIYNKEDLISQVLENVIKCCGSNSHIYLVLDGCTDNSETIIDEIISLNFDTQITKIFADDVHELLSINAGLKVASHKGTGYNLILQDDVLIEDFDIEQKIINLYALEGEKLGYVSFRMGANLKKDALISRDAVPYTDYVENTFGHGGEYIEMLPLGHIAYRTVPIKSPVCIPFKIINQIGMYNAQLAPYGHDDIDLALRVIDKGYYNAVYAIKFKSELEWGGTRAEGHLVVDSIIERNMDLIRVWHKNLLQKITNSIQPLIVKQIEKDPIVNKGDCQKIWDRKIQSFSKARLVLSPIYKRIKNSVKARIGKKLDIRKYAKFNPKYDKDLSFTEVIEFYKNRNDIYMYFHQYFHHHLPKEIKDHREYIIKNKKGFGEDVFHAMWYKLIVEFKPTNLLEIGVYRGQVVSNWTLIGKLLNQDMNISGISPFSSFGDSVSEYLKNLDYYQDVQETFEELNLKKPTFIKGFSSDDKAVKYIKNKKWDLIYIDGGHDYEDVLFDYKLCLENLADNGIIVIDDSSLYTDYNPLSFAFKGHSGPSLVAREYADKEMKFLGAVGHNSIYMKKR